jgi:hypothetical protein
MLCVVETFAWRGSRARRWGSLSPREPPAAATAEARPRHGRRSALAMNYAHLCDLAPNADELVCDEAAMRDDSPA